MNHISTLTVTQQYIRNQVQQITKQNSDDILQVLSALMSAIDERFKEHEAAIKQVKGSSDLHLLKKGNKFGHKNSRH